MGGGNSGSYGTPLLNHSQPNISIANSRNTLKNKYFEVNKAKYLFTLLVYEFIKSVLKAALISNEWWNYY